jgi:hypothetical protein
MDNGQRIEMQERAIELLARALTSDPKGQALLIRVAKVDALEAMNILPIPAPDSYPVGGHESAQPEDL